jgi:hypothetical protein
LTAVTVRLEAARHRGQTAAGADVAEIVDGDRQSDVAEIVELGGEHDTAGGEEGLDVSRRSGQGHGQRVPADGDICG